MRDGKIKKIAIGMIVIAVIAVIIASVVMQMVAVRQVERSANVQDEVEDVKEEIFETANEEREIALARPTVVRNSNGDTVEITMENWREYWDETKVTAVADTNGVLVPVPLGYTSSRVTDGTNYVERTVNTGFVIYEGTDDVTGIYTVSNNIATMDDSIRNAQYTRNQWVWVPVYDVSRIYGVDSTGRKWGKLYNYSGTGRTALNWTGNATTKIINISDKNGYREPDILTGDFDTDLRVQRYIVEGERNELIKEIRSTYENVIASIEKYGGVYIGRYEMGDVSKEAKVVKEKTDIRSLGWYNLYWKSKYLSGDNNNVTTTMIYGSIWDETLQWLVESGNKSYSTIANNSTGWGNYIDTQFNYTDINGVTSTRRGGTIPTGSSERNKANNIYDLAGNVGEWTIESQGAKYRVLRGGDSGKIWVHDGSNNYYQYSRYYCRNS